LEEQLQNEYLLAQTAVHGAYKDRFYSRKETELSAQLQLVVELNELRLENDRLMERLKEAEARREHTRQKIVSFIHQNDYFNLKKREKELLAQVKRLKQSAGPGLGFARRTTYRRPTALELPNLESRAYMTDAGPAQVERLADRVRVTLPF
jgi:predicted nuclease with TOPRIM domain